MDETSNTLFHGGSMQVKDSGDTAVLVLLIAASQIPDDRDVQIQTKCENQAIALSHVIIGHTFCWSGAKWVVNMDVGSAAWLYGWATEGTLVEVHY